MVKLGFNSSSLILKSISCWAQRCPYVPPSHGNHGSAPAMNCTPGQRRPLWDQNKILFCTEAGECLPFSLSPCVHWGSKPFACVPPEDRALAAVSALLPLGLRVGLETDILLSSPFPHLSPDLHVVAGAGGWSVY